MFGVFFLLAFVAYGLGSGLINTLIASPNGLSAIHLHQAQVVFGAILMAIVHTFLNIGLAVILFRLLQHYNRYMAYGYFSAAITATVMLIVGTVFLLLLVPVSDAFVQAAPADVSYLQTLSALCQRGNFASYQTGMAIWGLGGLMLCYLLYRSKLVPRAIAVWGIAGYVIFIVGTILELSGYEVGLFFDIPGGLFELFLSFWLILKGGNPAALQATA